MTANVCVRDDVVIRLENGMLRRFSHVEKMGDKRTTPPIYGTDVDGNEAMLFQSLKKLGRK